MKFIVENQIFEKFPEVKLGLVFGSDIDNSGKSVEIQELLENWQLEQAQKFSNIEISTYDKIAPWREAYSKFGAKPSKYNSSIESLLKRVKSGGKLPTINNLVDLYNAISLEFELPFGAEDLDKVKGDIRLAFAKGNEPGKYIGSDKIDTCEKSEVAYLDELGFICRRWNWREADRTKITEGTKNFILVAEALPPVLWEGLSKAIEKFVALSKKYLGGDYKMVVLDSNNPTFEVDFETGSKISEEDIKTLRISGKEAIVSTGVTFVQQKQLKEYTGNSKIISDAVKKVSGLDTVCIEFVENETFGDYSSNVVMILVKEKERGAKSRELAEEIVAGLNKVPNLAKIVDKVEVAGPGFINFWLKKDVLVDNLIEIDNRGEKYGSSNFGKDKTIVIDYSSPNIAKRFSIGHLRSTIIGQAIYNLYKFLGYEVIGDNHLGDWGTQFGTLLYQIDRQQLTVNELTIDKLEELYVKFHREAEDNPGLWDEAREWFKKLEDGDAQARKLWQLCVDVSMKEFSRIYEMLGVKIDFVFGESYYESEMKQIMIDSKVKKHLTKGEGGALVIDLTKEGIITPLMFLKADGATTYATRDLATITFRVRKWNPDIIIYEVGVEQSLHFKQLFAAARLMGLVDKSVTFIHTAHGLYLAPDGKKFSTRQGKTIKLEEVLDEAIARAKKLQKEDDGPASVETTARQVGIGAIKYFDLMHSVQSNVVFDWDKIMNMEGNSGPYLQYTVARTNSVLQKGLGTRRLGNSSKKLVPEELAVLRTLFRFPEIIESAAKNYSPNVLCSYLFDLAQKFNNFYNIHRIIDSDNEGIRLRLTSAVGQVLKNGLKLLGIQTPKKM